MSDAQLEIILTAQDATNKAFSSLSYQIKNITNELFSFKGILAGLATGYVGQELAADFLETGLAAESMGKSLEAATGGIDQATSAYAFLNEQSDRLGLQFELQVSGFQKIAAAAQGTALEGDGVRKVFVGLAEASAAMQLDAEASERVLNAVSQMMSKGKVSAEELRQQIGESLPGAFRLAAEAMGVSTKELDKMMSDGKLFSEDFLPKFAAALHKNYGEAAENASNTAVAAFNRMKNTWYDVQTTVMSEDVMQVIGNAVKDIQQDIQGWVDANEELIKQNVADFAKDAAWAFSEFLTYLPGVIDVVSTLANGLWHLGQVVIAGMLMNALAGLPALWAAASNAMIAYNMSILTAHASSLAFSGVLGGLQVAAGTLLAAFAGWHIGQWLSEEFEAARMAGIAMIDGLFKGWISFKTGLVTIWETVKYAASESLTWIQKAAASAFQTVADAMKSVPDAMPGSELIKSYAVNVELLALKLEKSAKAGKSYGSVIDKIAISYDQQINAHEAMIESMLEEQTTYISNERVMVDYIDIKASQTDAEKDTQKAMTATGAAAKNMSGAMSAAASSGAKSAKTLKNEWDEFLDPFKKVDQSLAGFFNEIDQESKKISDQLEGEIQARHSAYDKMYRDMGAAAEGYREFYVQELEKERDAFIKATGDKEAAYIWFSKKMGDLDKNVADAQKKAHEETSIGWLETFGNIFENVEDGWASSAEKMLGFFASALGDMDGLGKLFGASLSQNLSGILSGISNGNFGDLAEGISGLFSDDSKSELGSLFSGDGILGGLGDIFTGDGLLGSIGDTVSGWASSITDFAKPALDSISKITGGLGNAVGGLAGAAAGLISGSMFEGNVGSNIVQTLGGFTAYGGALSTAGSAIGGMFGEEGGAIGGGIGAGAALGGTIGSVIPGIGTAIGAVAGAIIGGVASLFGDEGEIRQAIDPTQFKFVEALALNHSEDNAGGDANYGMEATAAAAEVQQGVWAQMDALASHLPEEYLEEFKQNLSNQTVNIGGGGFKIREEHKEEDIAITRKVAQTEMYRAAFDPMLEVLRDLEADGIDAAAGVMTAGEALKETWGGIDGEVIWSGEIDQHLESFEGWMNQIALLADQYEGTIAEIEDAAAKEEELQAEMSAAEKKRVEDLAATMEIVASIGEVAPAMTPLQEALLATNNEIDALAAQIVSLGGSTADLTQLETARIEALEDAAASTIFGDLNLNSGLSGVIAEYENMMASSEEISARMAEMDEQAKMLIFKPAEEQAAWKEEYDALAAQLEEIGSMDQLAENFNTSVQDALISGLQMIEIEETAAAMQNNIIQPMIDSIAAGVISGAYDYASAVGQISGLDFSGDLQSLVGAVQAPGYASGGIIDSMLAPGEDGLVSVKSGEGVVTPQGMEALAALNAGQLGGGNDRPIVIRLEAGGVIVDEFTVKKWSDEVRVEADNRGMGGRKIY